MLHANYSLRYPIARDSHGNILTVKLRKSNPIFQPSVSAGKPDLFKYAQCSVFTVKFLGHLGNVQSHRGAQAGQGEMLEIIDAAQVRINQLYSTENPWSSWIHAHLFPGSPLHGWSGGGWECTYCLGRTLCFHNARVARTRYIHFGFSSSTFDIFGVMQIRDPSLGSWNVWHQPLMTLL